MIHHPNRFPQDHQITKVIHCSYISPRVWSFNCDNSSRNVKACDHKEPRPMALKAWEKCSYKGGENGCLGPSNNVNFETLALVFGRNIYIRILDHTSSISYGNQGPPTVPAATRLGAKPSIRACWKAAKANCHWWLFSPFDTKRDCQLHLDLESTWQFEMKGVFRYSPMQCNIDSHDLGWRYLMSQKMARFGWSPEFAIWWINMFLLGFEAGKVC